MRPNTSRGFLFAFCGTEGDEKKAVLHRLQGELKANYWQQHRDNAERGDDVIRMDMSWSGENSGPYCSLSFVEWSMRLKNAMEKIERALQKGSVVLCEEYLYSFLADCSAPERFSHDLAEMAVQPEVTFLFEGIGSSIDKVRPSFDKTESTIVITGNSQEERYQQTKETIERVIKNGRK